jgi:hypothetical protein
MKAITPPANHTRPRPSRILIKTSDYFALRLASSGTLPETIIVGNDYLIKPTLLK